MLRSLQKLIERQMLIAQAEGKLSGLEGEGKPLPDRSSESTGDPVAAVGFRIMAQAGVVPEEITLKKQLDEARAEWRDARDENTRKEEMTRITDLEMRYNMARDARRAFLR